MLVLAPSAVAADGFALLKLLRQRGATLMQPTPSRWRLLLEAGFVSAPGFKMLCGGEALSDDVAKALLAGGGELWNMYGPTETTIWSSAGRVFADKRPITIGAPIANTQLYVLDGANQPLPVGVPGELHIGGAGVGKGYVNRDSLTAEKFIADPIRPKGQGRLYRTGDLACRLAEGGIKLLGRVDDQVKLRGFRIELGEIEAVLARKSGLSSVAVALREDRPGDQRLVGYLVEPEIGRRRSATQLRALLADELPDYMVPSAWVHVDALPLSASGKLDRRRLPAPEDIAAPSSSSPPRTATPPRTARESELADIWADVLGRSGIGVEDDLFDLGVDSLQIFRIVARAHRAGLGLTAKDLLTHRTIAAIAASTGAAEPMARALPPLVRVSRDAYRASPAQGRHQESAS
jgi:acyl-coenzyme A synthetase/AMP-(fatty) acid ligase/aryl carrier-like protein